MRDLERETVDNGEILNLGNETKILFKEDKYKNDSVEELEEAHPDRIGKFEEAFFNYIGENDLKILKTDFPDNKWKYLTKKLAFS